MDQSKPVNMPKFFFSLLFCFAWTILCAQSGKDYALFFVVTDFDYWQDFPQSSADQVDEIIKELESVYGFKTELILNPTRSQILGKIASYQRKSFKPNDQLLIYFSMHGQYEAGGIGALIPKNGKLNDPNLDSWIYHPLLADQINRIPCQHILLGLDACYSGTFGAKYKSKPEKPIWETKKECLDKRNSALTYKSRLYLTSGGAERTPTDSDFAEKWLEALRLRNTDGVLGFHELYAVLNEATNPKPMFGDFHDHIKGGDFVFLSKNQCRPVEVLTDAAHWQSLRGTQNRETLLKHLQDYQDCTHEAEIFQIISGKDFTPAEPATGDENKRPTNPPNREVPDNMVYVQGGTFQMGSEDGDSDEKPIHQVTLSDYYMSRYELTVQEFSRFISATGYKTDAEKDGGSYFWEDSKWQKKAGTDWRYNAKGDLRPNAEYDHPVIHVSWNDAIAYCNWRSELEGYTPVYTISGNSVTADWKANGYRLPTEAEWEYAARSRGKNYKYAWGNGKPNGSIADEAAKAKFSGWTIWEDYTDGYIYTSPVGQFEQGDLGLTDMTGNVWEWCWDWKDTYPSSAQTNPHGPVSGSDRVIRGGSWLNVPAYLRCAIRNLSSPGYGSLNVGFRLSRAAR